MLAPNAPLRAAVTALALEQAADTSPPGLDRDREAFHTAADGTRPAQAGTGKARYRWAVLLARIFEALPLTCTHCSGEMWITAFVTDPASIQLTLAHIGEPTRPPPLAQPEPEYIFDQRIAW